MITSSADVDLTLLVRRRHSPPPSVLLVTLPSQTLNSDRRQPLSPAAQQRTDVEKHQRRVAPPAFVGFQVHEPLTSSSLSWQRHSEKIAQLTAAPDVAYRNTYLDADKRETSDKRRSPSSHVLHSARRSMASPSPPYSVYDYIRQVEQQRKIKQANLTGRVQRPQNEDCTLRRILAEKKSSARSRTSVTTSNSYSTVSSFNQDLKSPQSFVNYINYSRIFPSVVPH